MQSGCTTCDMGIDHSQHYNTLQKSKQSFFCKALIHVDTTIYLYHHLALFQCHLYNYNLGHSMHPGFLSMAINFSTCIISYHQALHQIWHI